MDAIPVIDLSPAEAFSRAVELAGGQVLTSMLIGWSQSAISKRLAAGKPIWAEFGPLERAAAEANPILAMEAATGVSRHDLRPDIYPREDAAA